MYQKIIRFLTYSLFALTFSALTTVTYASKKISPEDKRIILKLNNEQRTLLRDKKYEAAIIVLKKLADVYKRMHGENHLSYLSANSAIAGAHAALKQYKKAQAIFKTTISAIEKMVPGDHPVLVSEYESYGLVLYHMKQYDEAQSYLSKIIKINFDRPETHKRLLVVLDALGTIYKTQNKLKEAVATYRIALKVKRKLLPKAHIGFLETFMELGKIQVKRNRYCPAVIYFRQANFLLKTKIGANHPATAATTQAIKNICHVGIKQVQTFLSSAEKNYGPKHKTTVITKRLLDVCVSICQTSSKVR